MSESRIVRRDPYVSVSLIAIDDQRLDQNDICVYMALSRFGNGFDEAFPSVATIMKLSRVPRSSVYRSLKKLESVGYIKRTKRWGSSGGQRSSLYEIFNRPHGDDKDATPADPVETPVDHESTTRTHDRTMSSREGHPPRPPHGHDIDRQSKDANRKRKEGEQQPSSIHFFNSKQIGRLRAVNKDFRITAEQDAELRRLDLPPAALFLSVLAWLKSKPGRGDLKYYLSDGCHRDVTEDMARESRRQEAHKRQQRREDEAREIRAQQQLAESNGWAPSFSFRRSSDDKTEQGDFADAR